MNRTFGFIAVLWCCTLFASAQSSPLTKTVTIKPSAPNASWEVELPPMATATVTLTVEPEGDVGKIHYKLKPGTSPEAKLNPENPSILWSRTGSGNSYTYNFTNTAPTPTPITASLSCIWSADKGGGSGGSGPGTAEPDIKGLAKAIASFALAGSCAWTFDRTTIVNEQIINWTVTFVDADGKPITTPSSVPVSLVEAVKEPTSASWSITPTSGSAEPLLSGTVRLSPNSSKASTGRLKISYTMNGAAETCQSETKLTLLPAEVRFTRNIGTKTTIGDIGEFGQKSAFATGSFSVVDKMRATSILTISSTASDYNCNTVVGNLGVTGGMFKAEIINLPPGNYSVNVTVYASASSSNSYSGSKVLIYAPNQNALMSGFGRMSKPYRQEKTFDIPVTVNASGVGSVVTSEPVVTGSDGGTGSQSISIKINSIESK
jgi:hypothetical protein